MMNLRKYFCIFLFSSALLATDATWNLDGNGNWNVNANWTPATFPNAVDDIARFLGNNTALRTSTVNQAITIGSLFLNSSLPWVISASSPLTFQVSSGNATIDAVCTDSSYVISGSSGLILNSNLTVSSSGTNPLFTTTGISGTGSLTKTGTGTLSLSGVNSYSGGTTVSQGILQSNNSSALQGTVVNNAVIQFQNGNCAANISGSGSVEKTINTTILSGTNSYTGGTLISGGTLQGTTTSLQGAIVDNAALIFNQSTTGTYSGSLSGTGTLQKQGSGTLTFSGASVLSGQTTVTAGTFLVTGTFGGPGTLVVNSGATLGGTGTISKNITMNGILNPGASIDTLNIVGTLTFGSGSTFDVELTPTSNDSVNVVGNVVIQSGSSLSILPTLGTYTNHRYVLINTTSGVSGTFSSVSVFPPLFDPTITYTATQVLLTIGIIPFEGLFDKGNLGQVAKCLDEHPPVDGSDLDFVVGNLMILPTVEELEAALIQMQPSAFTSIALANQENVLFVKDMLVNRMDQIHHSCCCQRHFGSFWVAPFASTSKQRNGRIEPGYDDIVPGVLVGVDGFAGNLYAGASLGYSYTHLKWRGNRGSAKLHAAYAALYSRLTGDIGYLEGSLMGNFSSIGISRHIEFGLIDRNAQSSHPAWTGNAHVRTGFVLPAGCLRWGPYIDATGICMYEHSFREGGALSLNLEIEDKVSTMVATEAGLDFSYCFLRERPFTPFLQVGVIRESRLSGVRERAMFHVCELDVTGLYPTRTLGTIAAGINSTVGCDLPFSFYYRGKFSERFQDHSFEFTTTF